MQYSQKLIEGCLKACGSDLNAERISEELLEACRISREIHDLEIEEHELSHKFLMDCNTIRQKKRALVQKCKHWSRTRCHDPAGGNDSHTYCDVCGAEIC